MKKDKRSSEQLLYGLMDVCNLKATIWTGELFRAQRNLSAIAADLRLIESVLALAAIKRPFRESLPYLIRHEWHSPSTKNLAQKLIEQLQKELAS